MATMEMTKDQKAIQAADDLDEQASELNAYIADSDVEKALREEAVTKQLALRQQAADIRVNLVREIAGTGAPLVDEVVAAADRAKAAAKKINNVKDELNLAAATIVFFAALSSGNLSAVKPAWKSFKDALDKAENTA